MKGKDRKMVARFRCGNEVREREHWKEEEEKMCRLCKKEKESLWHVIKVCEVTRQEEEMQVVLGEEGQGLRSIREIVEKRREMEKRREEEGEEVKKTIETNEERRRRRYIDIYTL